jgi:hypothetical protein
MSGGQVEIAADFKGIDQVLRAAPMATYRHLREFYFASFLSHRKTWLKRKGTKFGGSGVRKDGTTGKGIKVYKVGEVAPTKLQSVHYDVPKERRATSPSDAVEKLQKLNPEIRTGSLVLPVHEFGKTVKAKAGGMLVVPVKTRSGIREFKQKYPGRKLRWLMRGSKGAMVFEQIGKRKKRFRLRWILKPSVVNKPVLRFYETWDRLSSVRTLKWKKASTDMVIDMERGKT